MNALHEVLGRPSPPSGPGLAAWPPARRDLRRKALLDRFRDARFSEGIFCPRCGHREVQGWGSFSGRQRYRCKSCRRTFSDLTGTPAAYLKKIELLPSYCDALAAQLSVRRCALQLGIHPSTAFRWRHRLFDWLRWHDTDTVGGWVELGSFWLPESHKGAKGRRRRNGSQRHSARTQTSAPGRGRRHNRSRRGRWSRWNLFYEGPRVHVAIACDRTGRVVSGVCPPPTTGPLTAGALEAAIDGCIERGASLNLIASRETRSAAITFAPRIGATYHDVSLDVRRRPSERSLIHVRTVVPYIRRLRDWLRVFRGVATRYLPNYLLWHRLVDADLRNSFPSLLLRWPHHPPITRP